MAKWLQSKTDLVAHKYEQVPGKWESDFWARKCKWPYWQISPGNPRTTRRCKRCVDQR